MLEKSLNAAMAGSAQPALDWGVSGKRLRDRSLPPARLWKQ